MILLNGIQAGHVGPVFAGDRAEWQSGANGIGGVSVKLSFKNDTEKTVRRVCFTAVPCDAAGEPVVCRVSQKSEARLEDTGSMEPGETLVNRLWKNVWYNDKITAIKLEKVEVEYADGSKETLEGDGIPFEDPPKAGCYVATAVYGSYDCPQVWTLRRFRDGILARTWHGRAFVRLYYAASPALVRRFGKAAWFQRLWRGPLDRLVLKLRRQGVADTPYCDKPWPSLHA